MAFRFRAGDDLDVPVNHDINVTPFIDVMLVLLIIFMVAAPLATVDFKVDLPVSSAAPSEKPDKPVFITIRQDGGLLVNERAVNAGELGAAVKATATEGEDQRIYLRADKTVPYERIMEAMNALRGEGFLKIALVGLEGGAAQ